MSGAASWLRRYLARLAPEDLSANGKIRADAMLLVLGEMKWQDEKFGAARHLEMSKWISLAVEEAGEVAKANNDHEGAPRLVEELAQLAALSLQAIEDLLRHATPAEINAVFKEKTR
jgi:NTP pyrophosphatase (non-canonical NTP hydrolase)